MSSLNVTVGHVGNGSFSLWGTVLCGLLEQTGNCLSVYKAPCLFSKLANECIHTHIDSEPLPLAIPTLLQYHLNTTSIPLQHRLNTATMFSKSILAAGLVAIAGLAAANPIRKNTIHERQAIEIQETPAYCQVTGNERASDRYIYFDRSKGKSCEELF